MVNKYREKLKVKYRNIVDYELKLNKQSNIPV